MPLHLSGVVCLVAQIQSRLPWQQLRTPNTWERATNNEPLCHMDELPKFAQLIARVLPVSKTEFWFYLLHFQLSPTFWSSIPCHFSLLSNEATEPDHTTTFGANNRITLRKSPPAPIVSERIPFLPRRLRQRHPQWPARVPPRTPQTTCSLPTTRPKTPRPQAHLDMEPVFDS